MLEEKILNDYKEAMKSRDTLKSTALNFLRAKIMNAALEKKKDKLDDAEITAVIRKQIKERQDSIEQFRKGGRIDLADKETKELEILKAYLPQELAPEEVKKIVEAVILVCGAESIKDMGKVMKEVMFRIGTQADARIVSALVKDRLSVK